MLPFSFTANSALSATTSKTIQGTAPTFKAISGENRLGFTVGGKFYSESSIDTATTGKIESGTVKNFNPNLTFNDFLVVSPTFTVVDDYEDNDGDIAHSTTPFTQGAMTYKWTDNANAPITGANLSKMIGCGGDYSMPLKLAITLSNVQVHSEYGDPRESTSTNLTKTYQITGRGICTAKPNQMIVDPTHTWLTVSNGWNAGNVKPDVNNGGGYDSNVFDPVNGFKASASTKFPTTGFPGAQFQLMMTGSQTDWTYSVPTHSAEVVSVDAMGNVLLKQKPSGEVTVRATLKADNNVYDDYKFTPTKVWLVPKSGTYNYAAAINTCGGETKIPTRADLTNSPRNTGLSNVNWPNTVNYYTRAIGGGVFSEWGYLDNTRYPSSQWVYKPYWTQDLHTTGNVNFIVFSDSGYVGFHSMSDSNDYVACRE